MNKVIDIIIKIAWFIILLGVVQLIFNFFSISVSNYIIYFGWIIALLLFYFILPSDYNLFKIRDTSAVPMDTRIRGGVKKYKPR